MTSPRPDGTVDGNLNKQPCDRDNGPSTSTWPSTELALETPERNRWRYKRRSDTVYSTPPRIISPKTPKMKRQRPISPVRIPGKCLINNSPSPLRRFRISQSCSSFTASAEKKKDRIEYRIGGNLTNNLPLSTVNDSLEDSGISSINSSNNYFSNSDFSCLYEDGFSADSYFYDPFNQNNFPDYSSLAGDDWLRSNQSVGNQVAFDETLPQGFNQNISPAETNFEKSPKILHNSSADPVPPVRSPKSPQIYEEKKESTVKIDRVKQKTLEEKILTELSKYDHVSFNEEYAEKVDMTEFRKLKLMSSLTSSYYRVVLGRSRDQIELTREAHKYLNSKRVKSVKK